MNHVAQTIVAAAALIVASATPATALAADVSFDGLQPVEGANVAMAYIDPDADFSVFKRVVILEPLVAFRSNWQRDQNRAEDRRSEEPPTDELVPAHPHQRQAVQRSQ